MQPPLHPIVAHVPTGLAMVLPLVALGVGIAWWRGWLPARTWAVVVLLHALMTIGGVAAQVTGEAEERNIGGGVAAEAIERHEEAAKVLVFSAVGVLVLMVLPLVLVRDSHRRWAAGAAIAGSVAVAALALEAGHRGGVLVYEHGLPGSGR